MTPRETAIARIRSLAEAAEHPESANGYRHSALVLTLFRSASRALWQLRRHAGFTGSAQKAAAYRRAAEIYTDLTGEAAAEPPVTHTASLLPGFSLDIATP